MDDSSPITTQHLRASNVGSGVDEAHHIRAVGGTFVEAERSRKRQICAVAALLIPTLDGSTNRASDDGEVERLGNPPFVGDFCLEDGHLGVVELVLSVNILEVVRVLCDQGTLLEVLGMFAKALFVDEIIDLGHELVSWNAGEGILDLGFEIGGQVGLVDESVVICTLLCMRCLFILRSIHVVGQQRTCASPDERNVKDSAKASFGGTYGCAGSTPVILSSTAMARRAIEDQMGRRSAPRLVYCPGLSLGRRGPEKCGTASTKAAGATDLK